MILKSTPSGYDPTGVQRFPACAKPWLAPLVVLEASAGEGRSEKIMRKKEGTLASAAGFDPSLILREEEMMSVVDAKLEPLTFHFKDDGLMPNNRMPFLVYKGAIVVGGTEPERTIEMLFAQNGWGDMWRNGIYDFAHFHATVHEVLGIARGHARVRFGGERGKELDIAAGDVAILPAGTGHQRISASADLSVVGAYPPGPPMDLQRPSPESHARALQTIPRVALPKTDPVLGADGPLLRLWKRG